MKQKTGVVKSIRGQFKAVDKDGNVRILKAGDIIYEGDEVSSIHEKDGGLSDAIDIENMNSDDYFVLVEDLRTSEAYLVPQGGYRYFDIQDMGSDNTSISRYIVSSDQAIESIDDDRAMNTLFDQPLAEPREFLSSSKRVVSDQEMSDGEEAAPKQTFVQEKEPQPQPFSEPKTAAEPLPQPEPAARQPEPEPPSVLPPKPEPEPNQPPVIGDGDSSGTITEIADGASGANTAIHTATGTLKFTDSDSGSHSVSAEPKESGYIGTFTPTIDTVTGEVHWEFTAPDADLDHLKEGEVVTQIYTITVDDGNGGTATRDVTVTINGKNENPEPVVDTGSVSENTPEVSGNVLGNDQDINGDSLTVTQVNGSDPSTAVATEYGTVTINPDGSYTYTADITNPAVSGMNDGDSLVDTITYTVDDGNGGSATQIINITINGNNGSPVIGNGDTAGTITEVIAGEPGENDITHTTSGTFTFTDSDSGSHTVSAEPKEGGYFGEFTPSIDPATGDVNWTFSASDADLDHLKEGEVVTQIYTISVADGHGGTNTQDITITINGKNELPEPQPDTDSVSADSPVASGNVLGNDSDPNGDTLTVSKVNGSDPGTPVDTTYGTVTINADGSYNYSADTDNPAVAGLNNGDTLEDTITYTVDDGNGGTATETVTITIKGNNDAPVITGGDDSGSVTEVVADTPGENTKTHITEGTLTFTDIDNSTDDHSVTATPKEGGYIGTLTPTLDAATGNIHWEFSANDADLNTLKEGEVVTQVYTIKVTDSDGGTAEKDVTITINGKNELPEPWRYRYRDCYHHY